MSLVNNRQLGLPGPKEGANQASISALHYPKLKQPQKNKEKTVRAIFKTNSQREMRSNAIRNKGPSKSIDKVSGWQVL